jgi:hypothetical protein
VSLDGFCGCLAAGRCFLVCQLVPSGERALLVNKARCMFLLYQDGGVSIWRYAASACHNGH